jgi:hypothetical protein
MAVRVDELVEMAESFGIAVLKQKAFWKLGRGALRVYVGLSRTETCHRIDLAGPFALRHRAITPLSREKAAESHLGNVSAQIDTKQPREAVLDAVRQALAMVAGDEGNSAGAKKLDALPFSCLIPRDLHEKIERCREQMAANVEEGIEVSFAEAVMVLLRKGVKVYAEE